MILVLSAIFLVFFLITVLLFHEWVRISQEIELKKIELRRLKRVEIGMKLPEYEPVRVEEKQ